MTNRLTMIISLQDLNKIREQHKGKKIVLGSGVFDLLHAGHLQYLQTLQQHGDIVVVMVKSDARVRQGKGNNRPIITEGDRAQLVNAIKGIDYVFVPPHHTFTKDKPDPTYEIVLKQLQPDIFYSTNPVWRQLKPYSVEVVIGARPVQAMRSTTSIIEAVRGRTD